MSECSQPLVLFVDDEPRTLSGYRALLRKEAYDILTAGSGQDALELLGKNRVDVVISDERMPSMTGSELLERIHRDYPDIVRIMLTGEASLEVSVRAIKDGLFRFLSKPIEPDELRRVVASALSAKQANVDEPFARQASTRPGFAARRARLKADESGDA
jgi:DNA-binding NtrC family response regulator